MAKSQAKISMQVPAQKNAQGQWTGAGVYDYNGLPARDLNYSEITDVPLAVYYQKAGRILNMVPAVFYDTAVYLADTAITYATPATLFKVGHGRADNVVNTGAAIPNKPKCLTNMVADGEFDGGKTFIFEEMSIEAMILSDKVTTMTGGEIIDPTLTAEANYSASAHFFAITRQIEVAYFRNEQELISGRLCEFPSIFLASGAFGNDDGFIQNGVGKVGWNKLARARVLEAQDRFHFELRYIGNVGFTPQVPFNITLNMTGRATNPLFA